MGTCRAGRSQITLRARGTGRTSIALYALRTGWACDTLYALGASGTHFTRITLRAHLPSKALWP